MKHFFIVNPVAGKGKYLASLLTKIRFASEELGIDYTIYNTTTTRDATRYVNEQCEKYPNEDLRFYACGGDGTLNEVVCGVVGHANAQVAVIPVGTGNDFVRNFIKPELFLNIKHQILGSPVTIDLLKYNKGYAINEINVGLDCDVVAKMEELKKNALIPGGLTYYAALLSKFFGNFGSKASVALDDGEPQECDLTLIAMANGSYYGGGFKAAPFAHLDDGLIDVCMMCGATKADFIKAVADYKSGKHIRKNGMEPKYSFMSYKKCKKIDIFVNKPTGACADGEITPFRHLTVEVVPGAVSLSLPKGVGFIPYANSEESIADFANPQ